jgi:hypothetical protein
VPAKATTWADVLASRVVRRRRVRPREGTRNGAYTLRLWDLNSRKPLRRKRRSPEPPRILPASGGHPPRKAAVREPGGR